MLMKINLQFDENILYVSKLRKINFAIHTKYFQSKEV